MLKKGEELGKNWEKREHLIFVDSTVFGFCQVEYGNEEKNCDEEVCTECEGIMEIESEIGTFCCRNVIWIIQGNTQFLDCFVKILRGKNTGRNLLPECYHTTMKKGNFV